MYPTIRFSPTSQGCSTLRGSPQSGRNNPFATYRADGDDEADVHSVQMKLAVLEHQQSAMDSKVSELENAVKVLRTSADPSGAFAQQLLQLKSELVAAAEEDTKHRAELAGELRSELQEAKKQLRKELLASVKSSRGDEDKSFSSVPELEMQDEQPEVLAETRGEVAELASQLRAELAPFRAETSHSFDLWAAPLREEMRVLQQTVRQLQGTSADLWQQLAQPTEIQRLHKAFQTTVDSLAEELDSRSTELHKVFEHKLALLHEDWEAQARSMQQAQSSSLRKEYTFLVHAESTGLREELVGANTALRAEIASSQEKQLSDSREALKAAEADLKELKATFAAAAARSEDEKAAQAKIWSEVGGFRKELAKLDGQMQQLRQQQSAARPAGGEKPLGESEVRRLVGEALASPGVKAQHQESCEIALRPVHHRIDVAMSEVAKAKAAASEESKRARQELAGQLRAETEEVATNAASKARRSLDAEMRNVVDALRRQLLEAMETNSLRATQQFKESSASHNTEVRMLLDQLEDVRRFTHELSLSVRELQAKALDTGAQMRYSAAPAVDDLLFRRLEEELAGHMRLTSGKIRDLQELTGHLQARTADHTTRLQSLTGEAVAGNQRLETLAVLLETANVRLDRAEGVFSGMETRLQDVDTNMEKFFRGITALDARVDGVEAQATMPSRIVEAEEEASAPRANELDSPPWNAAVRGMENLTQIVGSLERSEGTPEPLVGVALREEVKEGFEEVWKAVRELQFRCAVPPRRPSLASETEQLQGAMPQEERPKARANAVVQDVKSQARQTREHSFGPGTWQSAKSQESDLDESLTEGSSSSSHSGPPATTRRE